MKIKKLCLDAGHGNLNSGHGYDPGAEGGGLTEAATVLDWALTLKFYAVQAGIPVWMSRDNATDADPVGTRDDRAQAAGCSHFLALHLNDGAATATGTETYYRDAADKQLAQLVQKSVCDTLGLRDRGLHGEGDSQHTRLAVFSFDGPCCLCELGFVSSAKDRAVLTSRDHRIAACKAIVAGLLATYTD